MLDERHALTMKLKGTKFGLRLILFPKVSSKNDNFYIKPLLDCKICVGVANVMEP